MTADVGAELEETIQKTWPDNIVKLVRSTERLGLIRARLAGADASSGDVLVFLDAHCEVNIVWYFLLNILEITFQRTFKFKRRLHKVELNADHIRWKQLRYQIVTESSHSLNDSQSE